MAFFVLPLICDVLESYLSSQSYKLYDSDMSQSHLTVVRVRNELVASSQSSITRTVESLQVIGLQA